MTATSSTIGPIIPSSISFVIYDLTTGVSIGGLFLGGMIPGALMGTSLMVLIHFISVKRSYGCRWPSMGIHPIPLGVVMVLNLMVGLITPQVGLCLFVVADIAKLPVMSG